MADSDGDGRSVSRGIVVLDHEQRDGVPGLMTITGGKLTTCRLMAEMVTDAVCARLGVKAACETALRPLPGSGKAHKDDEEVPYFKRAAIGRHGTEVSRMDFDLGHEIICECEQVTRAEIRYAVKTLGVRNISDLRRHTRIGMGTCQGSFCIRKVAEALAEELGQPLREKELIDEYLQERWKGITPVFWGDSLREAEYMQRTHKDEV